jgi:hypothetical protein
MQKPINNEFKIKTAAYFEQKASISKGKDKFLVALEMSKYLTAAREYGLSFEELKKLGFKFATV